MTDEEYEFTHQDVLSIIRGKNETYDIENRGSISFSGGSDSMLMSCLIDEAIPNNKIPRLYMNTGIEHQAMRKFVLGLAKKDDRFVILTPKVNIPKMLKKEGYPFKSKQHSQNYGVYFRNKKEANKYFEMIDNDKSLLQNVDFISKLPKGIKTNVKYVYGIREKELPTQNAERSGRERERNLYEYQDCP